MYYKASFFKFCDRIDVAYICVFLREKNYLKVKELSDDWGRAEASSKGLGAAVPQNPFFFVDTVVSNIFRDLLFIRNEPLKSADDR